MTTTTGATSPHTTSTTDDDLDITGPLDDVTEARYDDRLVDGAALDPDNSLIERHSLTDSASKESGAQSDAADERNRRH